MSDHIEEVVEDAVEEEKTVKEPVVYVRNSGGVNWPKVRDAFSTGDEELIVEVQKAVRKRSWF